MTRRTVARAPSEGWRRVRPRAALHLPARENPSATMSWPQASARPGAPPRRPSATGWQHPFPMSGCAWIRGAQSLGQHVGWSSAITGSADHIARLTGAASAPSVVPRPGAPGRRTRCGRPTASRPRLCPAIVVRPQRGAAAPPRGSRLAGREAAASSAPGTTSPREWAPPCAMALRARSEDATKAHSARRPMPCRRFWV